MKCLAFDIETKPNTVYTWGLFDQNVGLNQISIPGAVICWSAKWLGKRDIMFASDFHDGHDEMVRKCWELFNEADVIVHYNGKSFDVPWMNAEFIQLGLTPPAPFQQIDLYSAMKKCKFPSRKLEYISKAIGIGRKNKHEGFPLWVRCMEGNDAAWERMKRYNMQDVRLVERLYDRVLPWIPSIPSHATYNVNKACPACGSKNLSPRGTAYTALSQYQRYVCDDCGKWSRDTHVLRAKDGSMKRADITQVVQ